METTAIRDIDFYRLLRLFDQRIETDENVCILCFSDTNIKVDDFEWVLVSTSVHEKFFYRQILNIPRNCTNNLILTNTNLFNLNDCASSVIRPDIDVKLVLHASKNNFVPRYATSAKISMIQSKKKIDNSIIDECLQNYFEIPRYLHSGDLISIKISKYLPAALFQDYKISGKSLYFKVGIVEGPAYSDADLQASLGYFIANKHTTLHQVESVQCFIPSYHIEGSEAKEIDNMNNFFYPIVPEGIETIYSQLEEVVFPFLRLSFIKDVKLSPVFLISGKSGTGKSVLISTLAKKQGLHYWSENCIAIQNSNPAQTESVVNNIFTKISTISPCILHFRYIEGLCEDESGNTDDRTIDCFIKKIETLKSNYPVIIFCTTSEESKLPPSMHRIFLQILQIEPLNYDCRRSLLNWIVKKENITIENDEILDEMARSTTNFVFADLIQLVSRSLKISYQKCEQDLSLIHENLRVSNQEFLNALSEMNAAYADAIGAPEVPNVTWDDVGGLSHLKDEIMSSLMNSILPNGLKRSGLLLHGPPGTGKTLLAKAVATECKYNFLSVKGPELLNMYVGQSEKNVREVFSRARESSPCIIFFDELDSLAPKRGQSGGSGSVMDRVVSQLLAEMDGIQKSSGIFILAATNRPDLIDSALLRPGRLDKMLLVGSCKDMESKLSVLKALTRKFKFSSDVNLEELVTLLPASSEITGADLYGICSNAWLSAARRHINCIRASSNENFVDRNDSDEPVFVNNKDMSNAITEFMSKNVN